MFEEKLSSRLPEQWDYTDTNVVYSHPVPSESLPQGVMYCSGKCGPKLKGPVGEKDIMMYDDSNEIVGYIELKRGQSSKHTDRASEQLERAQKHWSKLGYDFMGGFSSGDDILPWNGFRIEDDPIPPEEFTPSQVKSSDSGSSSSGLYEQGDLAKQLIELGWDEAYEDVIYGMPLGSDEVPKGIARTNRHDAHFGQMDAVAYRDHEDGEIIGHVERHNESLGDIQGRLEFSQEFWTELGFEFQGAIYDDERIIPYNSAKSRQLIDLSHQPTKL